MIAWLVALGVPQRLAKPALFGGAAALLVLAFLLWLHLHDRAVVHAAQDRAEAKAAPIVRQADENASDSRARAQDAVRERQQEIVNATSPLPDQGLTARQRARACVVLRRQAAERGAEAPAGC